ncbi:MAG: hypothetical protein MUF33_10105 [Candidatus Nanopelagicales bacterium]|jgi:hypothetical protein|nr:hypothetical protein [Candidatus Nanopelagicales bacterium]MCU0298854.1 hypothetical protein [Candidatus Nanopelagicales bacterium]
MRVSLRWLKYCLAMPVSAAVVMSSLPAQAQTSPEPLAPAVTLHGAAKLAGEACDPSPKDSKPSNKGDCVTLSLAKKKFTRVAAGDTIVLKGTVRRQDASKTVKIQELQGGGQFGIVRKTKGRWKTIKTVTQNGSFTVKRKVSWGAHVYRAKVGLQTPSSSLSAANGSITSQSTATTAGAWGYAYIFANDTGRNLELTLSNGDSATGASASTSPMTFNDEEMLLAVLGDPAANIATGYTLEGEEAGIDYTYKYDGNGGDKPCAKSPQPTMGVGEVAIVIFENQTFGYKGTTEWPDGSTCTFEMLTSFEEFFADQGPWAIVLEVLAAVLIIAVIVAVTIVTGGADLPALADGAAAVAEGVEAGADVAEAAGEAAEEVAAELQDDLPNVQTFDGWPQNMGTMPSFPGGWQFVYPIPWVGGGGG